MGKIEKKKGRKRDGKGKVVGKGAENKGEEREEG